MTGPETPLLHKHVWMLRAISRTLGLIQRITPQGSWAFRARGWIIEQMYVAAVYADPDLAPTAHLKIEELRKGRERARKG